VRKCLCPNDSACEGQVNHTFGYRLAQCLIVSVFIDRAPETDIIRAMDRACPGPFSRAEIQVNPPSRRMTVTTVIDLGFGHIAPEN
jgi:hypothetical protein